MIQQLNFTIRRRIPINQKDDNHRKTNYRNNWIQKEEYPKSDKEGDEENR